ncbi:MAG: protein kinase [Vicinamibacteria bacterium]
MRARLGPGPRAVPARPQPASLEAYRAYLTGRYLRHSKNDHHGAMRAFEEAVRLDPSHAPSWVGLAEGAVLAALYGALPVAAALAKARSALAAARQLQGESADALAVEGHTGFAERRWRDAETAFRRALELEPGHVLALVPFGQMLCLWGAPDEGLSLARARGPPTPSPPCRARPPASACSSPAVATRPRASARRPSPSSRRTRWRSGPRAWPSSASAADEGVERAGRRPSAGGPRSSSACLGWAPASAGGATRQRRRALGELRAHPAAPRACVPGRPAGRSLPSARRTPLARLAQAEAEYWVVPVLHRPPRVDPFRADAFAALVARLELPFEARPPAVIGTTLANYRVTSAIGAGGMGEVYRATDTKLGREVAIKVLPEALAQDGERLARFEREAKLLASLNHPGIAHVYGFERVTLDGGAPAHFLAMELVEGEDLAERLKRGAIPVDEAVEIARQIAEALEEAHEKGIVHRDLKPANVKVTPDGKVKVLDFGLAKAWSGEGPGATSSADLSQSPTLAHTGTAAGIILGTAAYMSPEQARGKRVDRRADVWSFGVVLFEMLTGRRLFAGETVSDVLAGVLKTDPDWGALPRDTPEPVRGLLRRCLEREPLERLRDIGEARVLLSRRLEPAAAELPPSAASRRRALWPVVLPWALVALVVAGALATRRQPPADGSRGPETVRVTVPGPGPEYAMDATERPVVSADGRTLAVALRGPQGNALFVRPLDAFELQPVEGGGHLPFFSPDGRSLAFLRFGTVWKMDLAERRPSLVGRLNENVWNVGFAAWHPDGRLLIPGIAGLWSLPVTGGDAALLVASDAAAQEKVAAVSVLRDGRLALTIASRGVARVEIRAADATAPRVVARDVEQGAVVGDVLLTMRGGQWRASRLDLERLEPKGASVSLPDVPAGTLIAPSLAWIPGAALPPRELVWVARDGAATRLDLDLAPGYLRWPRLAPDGRRLALGSLKPGEPGGAFGGVRIGVVDLQTRRLTWLDGFSEPVWSADGRRVVMSLCCSPSGIAEQVADGGRRLEPLFTVASGEAYPTSTSRDGRWLVYYGREGDGASTERDLSDVFVLDRRTGERRRHALAGSQRAGRLSPDSTWLAYETTEGDRNHVHVVSFPALDRDYTVSVDGGQEPVWSADGKELYYRRGADVVRVVVPGHGETVSWPPPSVLFSGSYVYDDTGDQSYDVAPDGRLLMMRPRESGRVTIQVVLGWLAEVEARLRRAS